MYPLIMSTMLARDKKQVIVRLKPATKKAVRLIAAQNDSSVSAVIEQLIEASLIVKDSA
mgnify:CR=1 FL=1